MMQDPSQYPQPPLFGLSSYLQAMQIAQMLKQAHYAEQDRQMRLEDRQQALKDNEATRQRQKNQDVLTMNQVGAHPIAHGFGEPFERAAAAGRTVHAGESDYALPTPEMEQEQKVKTMLALLKATGHTINIPEELQSIYGEKTALLPREQALKASGDLYNLINPASQYHYTTDAQGNVHAIETNKRKGVVGEQVVPGAGKPLASRSGSSKLTISELNQKAQDEVVGKLYGGNRFVDNPEIAKAAQQRVASGKSRNAQEADWYIRNGNPNTIKILYPGLFKNGKLQDKIDVTDSPENKQEFMRSRSRLMSENRSGTLAGSSGPRGTKALPASQLQDLAAKATKQLKRRVDVNEIRKRLAARGVQIDEEN